MPYVSALGRKRTFGLSVIRKQTFSLIRATKPVPPTIRTNKKPGRDAVPRPGSSSCGRG